MDNRYKLIVDSFGKERFKFNESLKNYTALNIGGLAKLFFIAFTVKELTKIISMCRQLNLPLFLFGTGSKMIISDKGFAGLVIKNRTKDIHTISVKGKVTKFGRGVLGRGVLGIGVEEALIEVESGVSINKFIEFLDSQELETSDFAEFKGSIGGNLFLNKFLQMRVKSIKVYTLEDEVEEIRSEELSLKKHIILSAVFKMKAKT